VELTSPPAANPWRLLHARLADVPVLRNAYFGVEPYTLESLLIVSNGTDPPACG
jgi:hypothetical protein